MNDDIEMFKCVRRLIRYNRREKVSNTVNVKIDRLVEMKVVRKMMNVNLRIVSEIEWELKHEYSNN